MNPPHEGRCASCRFAAASFEEHRSEGLFCRRYPPTSHMVPSLSIALPKDHLGIGIQSTWPPVGPEEFCGEYAPRTESQPSLEAPSKGASTPHVPNRKGVTTQKGGSTP